MLLPWVFRSPLLSPAVFPVTTPCFHLCKRKPLDASVKPTNQQTTTLSSFLPPRFLALIFKTGIFTANDCGGFRNIHFNSQPRSKHFHQRSLTFFKKCEVSFSSKERPSIFPGLLANRGPLRQYLHLHVSELRLCLGHLE